VHVEQRRGLFIGCESEGECSIPLSTTDEISSSNWSHGNGVSIGDSLAYSYGESVPDTDSVSISEPIPYRESIPYTESISDTDIEFTAFRTGTKITPPFNWCDFRDCVWICWWNWVVLAGWVCLLPPRAGSGAGNAVNCSIIGWEGRIVDYGWRKAGWIGNVI
jgi:hypothetical protein